MPCLRMKHGALKKMRTPLRRYAHTDIITADLFAGQPQPFRFVVFFKYYKIINNIIFLCT